MSSRQKSPPEFAHLVNLAEDLTGTFVLWATDDYFAEKENLLRPDAPVFLAEKFTDKGKWMDGWETQRKRSDGHDVCIIRLGTPGAVHGVVFDTTHFRGNAPTQVLLEGIVAPYTASADELNARTDWHAIVVETPVKPNTENTVTLATPSARATHVRLHIFPDGGVARLRIFGDVVADDRLFLRSGVVDLAAVESGGTIAAVSDEFFGPPSNLLLPGRGANMGDGWETARRRTPGSDWCVIKLARRGVLERIELDTAFFKGNAPQTVIVEAIDEEAPSKDRLHTLGGWPVLISRTPLVQHKKHMLEPERPMIVTHLRVHIFPHGGVNRLRAFGHAVDTAHEALMVKTFNELPAAAASELLRSFCGSSTWAAQVLSQRPLSSARTMSAAMEQAWWSASEADHLEAFAAHPQIGATQASSSATAQSASWSSAEQAAMSTATTSTAATLAALNARYLEKNGFIYIVCAAGRSPTELLQVLQDRVDNDRASELENAAREQLKITRLRFEKWLASGQSDHAAKAGH